MPRLIDLEKLGELHGEADEMLKRRQARKNLRDVLSKPVEEPTPPPPPPKATTTPTSIGGLLGLDRPIRESVQEAESNVPRSQPLSGAAIPRPSTSLSGGVLGLTQPMTDFAKPPAPSKSGSLLQAATGGFKSGWYGTELGLQEYEKMWGRPNKAEEYQKTLQEHPEWQEQEPFKWSDILRDPKKAANHAVRGAAHTLALMLNLSAKAAVPAALTGIGVAAGASLAGLGTLAVQLGLQAANIAFTANQIQNMAKVEASDAYKEYVDSGVSPQVARAAAEIAGWINGTLEHAQFSELLGAGAAGREALKQLKKNTLTVALKNVVKKWAEGVNDESLEEAAQETVTVIGKHVANAIDERLKSKSFNAQQALEGILKNKDLYGPEVQELATRGYAALSQPDNAVNRALREIATRAPQAYGEAALSFGLLQIPGIASGVGQALYEDRTRRILGDLGVPQQQVQQPAPPQAKPASTQTQPTPVSVRAEETATQPTETTPTAQAHPQAPSIDEMAARIREEAQKQNKKITIKSPQASWIQKTVKTVFGQDITYAQARDIAHRVIRAQEAEGQPSVTTTTPATSPPSTSVVAPPVTEGTATAVPTETRGATPAPAAPEIVPVASETTATPEAQEARIAPTVPATPESVAPTGIKPWEMPLDDYTALAIQNGVMDTSKIKSEHREIVSNALKEGQEVPYLVLQDYPDLIEQALPKEREAAAEKIISWIREVEQSNLQGRNRDAARTRLLQLLGHRVTGVRLADAEETGALYLALKSGAISQELWDNYVAQLIRENKIKDKSILGIGESQETSAPEIGTTVPQEESVSVPQTGRPFSTELEGNAEASKGEVGEYNVGRQTGGNQEVPREERASVSSEQSLDSYAFASPQLAEWARVAYEKSKNKEYVLNVVRKVNELYTSLPKGVQDWINRRIDSRRPFIVIRDSINNIPEPLRPTFMQASAVTVNHARIELVADIHEKLDPEVLAHELVHLAWYDLEKSSSETIDRVVQESVEVGNKIIEFALKKKPDDFPGIAHYLKNVKKEILRYTKKKNKGESIDLTSALEMELTLGGSLSAAYVAEEAGVNIDSTDVITIAFYNALAKRLGLSLDSAYAREEIVAYFAGQDSKLLEKLFAPFASRQEEAQQTPAAEEGPAQAEQAATSGEKEESATPTETTPPSQEQQAQEEVGGKPAQEKTILTTAWELGREFRLDIPGYAVPQTLYIKEWKGKGGKHRLYVNGPFDKRRGISLPYGYYDYETGKWNGDTLYERIKDDNARALFRNTVISIAKAVEQGQKKGTIEFVERDGQISVKGMEEGTPDVQGEAKKDIAPITGLERRLSLRSVEDKQRYEGIVITRGRVLDEGAGYALNEKTRQVLRPHQQDGVNLAVAAIDAYGGFILADGTGAGKTLQELAVADYYARKGHRVLIVTPNRTIINNAFRKDASLLGVEINELGEDQQEVQAGKINITTYASLGKIKGTADYVVFDESHYLKNPGTAQSKRGMTLASQAKGVLFASATPLDKAGHVFYLRRLGIFRNRSYDEVMSSLGYRKKEIKTKKVTVTTWERAVPLEEAQKKLEAFFDELADLGLIAKREVSMDKVDVYFRTVTLTPEAHQQLDNIEDFYLKKYGELTGLAKAVMVMAQRRFQEPHKIEETIRLAEQELREGRQVVIFASRIEDSEIVDEIKEFYPDGSWVVMDREVFDTSEGTLKELADRLEKAGHEVARIFGTGKVDDEIRKFQEGKARIALVTPQKGGAGLSLDDTTGNAPRTMIVMTLPFSAVDAVQMAGRINRLNTKSRSKIIYLLADTAVDEWNKGIITEKMKTLHATVKGDIAKLEVEVASELPEEPLAPSQAEEKKKTPIVTGKTAVAKTERGTSVETQYAVVDANDLIASHTTSLTPNPAYPAELQPRNRARVASEEQVTRMLGNLEPSFLGESPKASEGAPIVSPDLVVESGNARVITLQRGYEQKHANMAKYKEWLLQNAEEFGLDRSAIEKIERPVLVRIRRTDVDRVKFVQEANEQAVAAMSASEQAMADAKKLTGDALAMFVANEQGEILTGPNMGFIQWFMANVVAPTERGRYMTSEGTISQEGVNRIKYAIFARAYGDTAAIEKLAESTDNNVRNITNAMLMAAPQLAKIRDGAERGYLYPLDITSDIAEAMKKLSALREQGMAVEEYLSQLGLFGDDLSPLAKEILQVFDKHARSAKKLTQILLAYAQAVQNLGNPNQQSLFEEVKVPTKLELFRTVVKQLSSDTGQAQGSLFALKAGMPDPAVKAKADTALAARIEEKRSSGLSLLVFAPEKTSVKQVARGLRIGVEKGIFTPGMVVADVGGGLYDDGTRYLEEHGITNLVYDPYARTEAHNSRVLDTIKSRGGADAVALNNVLNVIPKAEDRASVLQFAYSLLKDGGQMVITVYAGDGSGKGAMKEFRDGTYTWQENRKLETYKDEIAKALPDATIEKKYNAFIVTKHVKPQTDATLQALIASKPSTKDEAVREKLSRKADRPPVPLVANEDLLRLQRISPKATRQMVNIIGKAINSAVRRGRLHRAVVRATRGRLLGVHDTLTQAIRIHKKAWGSWRVMGHELGHAIMDFTNIKPDRREMSAIARELYPENPPIGRLTSEGFADFMALWFVDNLRARQLAPRTAKMIDGILEDNPQLKKAFNTAIKIAAADQEASGLDRWSNYIYTRDEEIAEPTGGEYKIENLLKRGLFEAVDFTIPLKDMMQAAVERGYKGIDFSKLAAISGAAWKRAIQWIKGKPKDFAGRLLLPEDARALGDIIREAEKLPGGLERFDQVYHVLRYYERWKRGFEPPVPVQDLQADVKEIMTKHREMAKLVREYATTLSEIRLRMLVRYGVISQETADRVRAGSDFYLPLITPRSAIGETTLTGEKDNRAAGQPVKRYAPKSDVTLDFLKASAYSLYQVAVACELNRIMQGIHKALSRKGMGLFGEVIDSPKVLKVISSADLSKQLERLLGEFLEGDADLNEDQGQFLIKLFLPGTIKDTPFSEPIIMARYGHRKVYMRVAPDVYKSVLAMRPLTMNLAQKALAQMGRISRAGALFNVRYITNNLMRDILAAQIQTESPERLFVISSLKGAAAAAGLDPDLVDLYIQSGAYGSAPTEFLESAVRSYKGLGLYPTKAAGWVRTAKGTLIRLVHTPADAVRILEEGPRIAEFEAVLRKRLAEIKEKTGKEIALKDVVRGKYDPDLAEAIEMALVDAAYASHEVTTNFALHGASSWVRGYVQLVPFLHGSIQGLYRAGRQFAEKPATTLLRIGLYLIPLTVMAFAVNHDEPEYEDIPSQARDRYWFFPLKKGFYIAIAKPYEYSLLINLMERYLDWAWAKSSPIRRKPLEDVGQMLRNQFSLPLIPLWAEAIMALAMNRDSFGTPIVPMSEQDLEPEMRYSPTKNSKAAIELSRLMARLTKGQYVASPRQIDFLIENTLGGIGKTGMSLISEVLNRATGKREGRTWQWTLDYNPVFGSLVYGPTEGGSRIVDRFHQDMERANRKYQSWLETQKTGRKPVNEITKEDAKLIKAYPAMKAISNMLAKERAALTAIQNDPSVKPEIKEKARLRYAWINKVAAGFLYAAPLPTPHPKAGITPAEAEDLLRYLDYLTRKAIVNALKRPGGPI